jgi:hypothetical protein
MAVGRACLLAQEMSLLSVGAQAVGLTRSSGCCWAGLLLGNYLRVPSSRVWGKERVRESGPLYQHWKG